VAREMDARGRPRAVDGARREHPRNRHARKPGSAKAYAAQWSPRMRKEAPGEPGIETVAEYAKRWLKHRDGRVASIRDDRSRMRDHVLPTLRPLDVAMLPRDDLERLRHALEVKITTGAT